MNCSLPGSSVHGIFQVRILEWGAISSSRRSSWSRDWTHVSCFGRQILYHWATWEAWNKADVVLNQGSDIYCHTVWGKWLTSVLQFSHLKELRHDYLPFRLIRGLKLAFVKCIAACLALSGQLMRENLLLFPVLVLFIILNELQGMRSVKEHWLLPLQRVGACL